MVMKPASTEDSGIISVEPIDPHMRLSDLSNLLHARIDGTAMMYHALAAVDRMQEVVKDMKDSCEMYQGHIGLALRAEPMEGRVKEWIAALDGTRKLDR
tara:strand:- start:45 stop:341 length:297 start_codon:yes stop_codon:yes gene_type:complete